MTKPKISIVWTARNDDYGSHLINRIETSLKTIIGFTKDFPGVFELIIVDYNPPLKKPYLYQILKINQHPHLSIKTIIVPSQLHLRFNTKIPLLEYVAKNIGIRRAKGDYILVTNPDIIFSPELIQFLSNTQLDPKTMYRANRHDISQTSFSSTLSEDIILALCKRKTIKILSQSGIIYASKIEWFKNLVSQMKSSHMVIDTINGYIKRFQYTKDIRFIPLIGKLFPHPPAEVDVVHEIAAGDFLLMHKNVWNKVRGYDQTPLSSYYDSYILYVLKYCHHIKHQVLNFPIYHIAHEYGKGGRQESSQDEYFTNIKKMKKTHQPYHINLSDWGFPTSNFEIIKI